MKRCFLILAFNKKNHVEELIASLREHSLPILLFDNGSENPFEFQDVLIRRIETNLGYAGGINKALDFAFENYDEVLFLTSDTKLLELKFPEIKVPYFLAPKIVFSNGQIDSLGGAYGPNGLRHLKDGLFNSLTEKFYVPGSAFFMNKACWDLSLRFHEPYFMYFEDVRYSIAIQELGALVSVFPFTVIEHKGKVSSHKKPYYSRYLFWKNWHLTNKYFDINQEMFQKSFLSLQNKNPECVHVKKLKEELTQHPSQDLVQELHFSR